jgi:hypothetical protein
MSRLNDDQKHVQRGWSESTVSDLDSSIASVESIESDGLYDDTLLEAGLGDTGMTGGATGHDPLDRRPSNVKEMVDNFEESDQFRCMSHVQGQGSGGTYGTVAFSSVGYAQRTSDSSYVGSVSPEVTDEPDFMNQLQSAIQRRKQTPPDGTYSMYGLESDVRLNGDHSGQHTPVSPYHTYYEKGECCFPGPNFHPRV